MKFRTQRFDGLQVDLRLKGNKKHRRQVQVKCIYRQDAFNLVHANACRFGLQRNRGLVASFPSFSFWLLAASWRVLSNSRIFLSVTVSNSFIIEILLSGHIGPDSGAARFQNLVCSIKHLVTQIIKVYPSNFIDFNRFVKRKKRVHRIVSGFSGEGLWGTNIDVVTVLFF